MSLLIDERIQYIIEPCTERSERVVLNEQLRLWRQQYRHIGNTIAQIEKRLAEIERDAVKREQAA